MKYYTVRVTDNSSADFLVAANDPHEANDIAAELSIYADPGRPDVIPVRTDSSTGVDLTEVDHDVWYTEKTRYEAKK